MKCFVISLLVVLPFVTGCERHDFEGEEGTKRLHEHHGHDDHVEVHDLDYHEDLLEHPDDHEDKEHASDPDAY